MTFWRFIGLSNFFSGDPTIIPDPRFGTDLKLPSGQSHPAGKNRTCTWYADFPSVEAYEVPKISDLDFFSNGEAATGPKDRSFWVLVWVLSISRSVLRGQASFGWDIRKQGLSEQKTFKSCRPTRLTLSMSRWLMTWSNPSWSPEVGRPSNTNADRGQMDVLLEWIPGWTPSNQCVWIVCRHRLEIFAGT